MKVYKTDRHAIDIKPGKTQVRVHIPTPIYEWLKSRSGSKQGLGSVITNLVEGHQDRHYLEQMLNALSGDVKRVLCHLKDDETVKNAYAQKSR